MAEVLAGIGKDALVMRPLRREALLVAQRGAELRAVARWRPALYCLEPRDPQ